MKKVYKKYILGDMAALYITDDERNSYGLMLLPEKLFCNVRTDDPDEADDPKKRDAHSGDDRRKEQGHKAQRIHIYTHSFSRRLTAQKRIVAPRHENKEKQAKSNGNEHDKIRFIGRSAKLTEIPYDCRRQSDIGSVKLEDRRCRSPH